MSHRTESTSVFRSCPARIETTSGSQACRRACPVARSASPRGTLGCICASAWSAGMSAVAMNRRTATHRARERGTTPIDPVAGARRGVGMVLHRPRRDARARGHGIHPDTTITARPLRSDRGTVGPVRRASALRRNAGPLVRSMASKYRAIERCGAGRGNPDCAGARTLRARHRS